MPSLVSRILRSPAAYCLALALLIVAGRLAFFDYAYYFELKYIPNHDMGNGVPFFATNLHSLRTSSEIAWWNPVAYDGHGYAQYYQAFLSPIAPTPHHVVFIVWSKLVQALDAAHIVIPEYVNYL